MQEVVLTGKDALQINGTLCTSFFDQTTSKVSLPNELANLKKGKNGNVAYMEVAAGDLGNLELRLLRGSIFDRFLQNLLALQQQNFAAFPLMNGQFVKNLGSGTGTVSMDTYKLIGGVFGKIPEVEGSAEGAENQACTFYTLKFGRIARQIL